MTEEKSDSKHDEQLQFFFHEQKIAVEEKWRISEYTWNMFKYYIILLTGVVGVLALIYIRLTKHCINYPINPIFIASVLIFIIGIFVLLHLMRVEKEGHKVVRRLFKAREEIKILTVLEEYFKKLETKNIGLGKKGPLKYAIKKKPLKYAIKKLIKCLLTGGGVKTHLIIINSIVFAIGLSNLGIFCTNPFFLGILYFGIVMICQSILVYLVSKKME